MLLLIFFRFIEGEHQRSPINYAIKFSDYSGLLCWFLQPFKDVAINWSCN